MSNYTPSGSSVWWLIVTNPILLSSSLSMVASCGWKWAVISHLDFLCLQEQAHQEEWNCWRGRWDPACSLDLCNFINMLGITVDVLCWLPSHLGFPGDTVIKNPLPTQERQETRVWSLGQEDPLEEEMTIHSNILTWKIPWTEEPGRLKSRELQRVRHNRAQHSSANETNVIKFWLKRCK